MKPVWRLSEILAAHKGQTDWTEPIVNDNYLHADYISMGPGQKTPRRFNADTREWWIIQDGQIRFTIEGQEPFVAGKGFMVEVPYRNVYSMETVGDKPSLRFEVNIAGATKDYPVDEKPPDIPGMEFVKITVASKGKYENGNNPYLRLQRRHLRKGPVQQLREGRPRRGQHHPGQGRADPGPATSGHFHVSSSEFWFIMEGKVRYAIETQPTFVADQGDVVYAPMGMWHLASNRGRRHVHSNCHERVRRSRPPLYGALRNMRIDPNKCVACGNCTYVCPMGAIYIDPAIKRATVNRDECVECYACYNGLSQEHLNPTLVRTLRKYFR